MGSLLTTPLTYIFGQFRRGDPQQLHPGYPESGNLSWLKQFVVFLWLKYFYSRQKRVCHHENDPTKGAESFGFLPSPKDWKNEKPKKFFKTDQNLKDEVFFCGGNKEGDFLVVSVTKLCDKNAEVRVFLKLSHRCYQLPIHPSTVVYVDDDETFSAAGLTLKCLSPLRRWRVAFCGLLRQISGEETLPDNNFGVYVKFSFVWLATGGIFDFQTETHPSLLSASIAREGYFLPSTKMKQVFDYLDCYEQWGQYAGTLTLGCEPEKEIYLWGAKARNGGVNNWKTLECNVRIYCNMEDGFSFDMSTLSAPGLVSHLQYGYISHRNRKILPIYHCDNILPRKDEGMLPDHFTFTFQAGVEMYIVEVNQLQDQLETFHGENQEIRVIARVTEFTIEDRKGYGVIQYSYRNHLDAKRVSKKPPTTLPISMSSINIRGFIPWMLSFRELLCRNSKISGGKGSSLALLTEIASLNEGRDISFSVPRGMVIGTPAYQHHLEVNKNLRDAIHTLEDCTGKDLDMLKELCKRVTTEFYNTPLDETVKNEITAKLQNIFPGDLSTYRFAVRSSAVGEDSSETSAAGQLETFLGIRGVNQIFEAVAKCWASQFSFTAMQYHRQTGQSITSGMAVVIQEMVPSQVSGVMFTCDPLTGNPGLISITANYGLGESVVSASAEPDTVILRKSLDNQVSFLSQTIGSKSICIKMADDSGTHEDKPSNESSKICCLPQDSALRLGRIGVLIQQAFASERDIEWALIGNLVYILQARPITTQNLETDFEIIHEFDTGHLTDSEYTTKANTGEVMPGAMTPLTISIVVNGLNVAGLANNVKNEEGKNAPYFPGAASILSSTHNHVMLNIIDTLYRINEKKATMMSRSWEIGMFGRLLEQSDEMRAIGIHRYGYTERSIAKFIPLIRMAVKMNGLIKTQQYKLQTYKIPYDQFQSSVSLYKEITTRIMDFHGAILCHFASSSLSSVYNGILFGILLQDKTEAAKEVFNIFGQLLSDCKDVESAEVPSALRDLAIVVSETTNREEFVNMVPEQALKWLQEDNGAAGEKYNSFIERHGHRCLKEFDFSSVPWGSDPCSLVKCIQTMVKNPNLKKTTKSEISVTDVLAQLPHQASNTSKYIIHYIISLARSAVRQREKSKSLYVKLIDIFRKAYLHLGLLMVKEWRLPEENLIFFLSHEEIGLLLHSRSAHLLSKAIRRRRLLKEMNELQFPEIVYGIPKPILPKQEINIDTSSCFIKGTPVCKGLVRSTARVAMNLEEAASIQPGDILITYSTDIGWSPYFPLLSGVVTELGGLISHGAVVAREYGLPCIVGAQNATLIFKSGETVILDGTQGILKKVDVEEET